MAGIERFQITAISGFSEGGGADMGFAEAALECKVPLRGCVPKFTPEKGWRSAVALEDAEKYGLYQHSDSSSFVSRDEANVDDSDVIIGVFLVDGNGMRPNTGRGSLNVIKYATRDLFGKVPYPVVRTGGETFSEQSDHHPTILCIGYSTAEEFTSPTVVERVANELLGGSLTNVRVMITGPMEATEPGIGEAVKQLFVKVFTTLGY